MTLTLWPLHYLSLHYARWQWQTGTNSGAPEGPFLELAYWIGPTRGVAPTQQEETSMNLGQYRDNRPRTRGVGPDRWVVFHLHMTAAENRALRTVSGRTRVGIQRVSMFHGPRTTGRQVGWRVDDSDYLGGRPNNRGPGFHCNDVPSLTTTNKMWYVGAPARNSLPLGAFYDTFSAWAARLFNDGYLSTPGISPILRGARFNPNNGDVDLSSNPAFLRREEPSSEFFGADPYQISFTVLRGDGTEYTYEFTIPHPSESP